MCLIDDALRRMEVVGTRAETPLLLYVARLGWHPLGKCIDLAVVFLCSGDLNDVRSRTDRRFAALWNDTVLVPHAGAERRSSAHLSQSTMRRSGAKYSGLLQQSAST